MLPRRARGPGFEMDTWPIFIWDAQSGKTVAVLDEYKDNFCQLALSGDGKTLASGGGAGIIYLWDASSIGENGAVAGSDSSEVEEEVVPRCKIDYHTTRGDTLTAKAWIDTPGEKLPSQSQIAAVWKQLCGKTEKKLVLHLFVPGMDLAQPPWAIAAQSDGAAPAIQRFDERAPAKFGGGAAPTIERFNHRAPVKFGGGAAKLIVDEPATVADGPNDPKKIAELKAVGFDVSVRDGRIISVKVYPDSATDEKIARLEGLKNVKSLTVTGPKDATLE